MMSSLFLSLAMLASLWQSSVIDLWLLLMALFGLALWVRARWQRMAIAATSAPASPVAGAMAWSRDDTLLVLAMGTVFWFKLLSTAWSQYTWLAVDNALWHLSFGLFPLLLLVVFRRNWSQGQVLGAITAVLCLSAAWVMWQAWQGKSVLWGTGRLNSGVLAQIVLVLALWLWVSATQAIRPGGRVTAVQAVHLLGALAGGYIVYSTTRRVEWGALFAVGGLVLLWRLRPWLTVVRGALAVLAFAALLALAVWLQQDRFLRAYQEIAMYLSSNGANALNTSVGARLEMYRRAIGAFVDSPWLGWGAGVRPAHLDAFSPNDVGDRFHRHFHSQYLQVMVEGGLAGLALAAWALFTWVRLMVWRPWRQQPETALLALVLLLAFLIEGLTSAALTFGAACCTFVLATAWLWAQMRRAGMAQHTA